VSSQYGREEGGAARKRRHGAGSGRGCRHGEGSGRQRRAREGGGAPAKNSIEEGSPPCSPQMPHLRRGGGGRGGGAQWPTVATQVGERGEVQWEGGHVRAGLVVRPFLTASRMSCPTPSRSRTCACRVRALRVARAAQDAARGRLCQHGTRG
jgi:hypothetical protein